MAKSPFKVKMCFMAYDLAKQGMSYFKIAQVLGISEVTFHHWKKNRPMFCEAVIRGRQAFKHIDTNFSFREYVYGKLPEHIKEIWDKINECDEEENGLLRLQSLLKNQGKKVRQHLFLYAWTSCNFSISKALKRLGFAKNVYLGWMEDDPEFATLADEVLWHKKNFFEDSLIDLVAAKNPQCTVFVNKTHNADRGYGEKLDVNVNGQIDHNFRIISIDKLELPIDTRKQILHQVRALDQ